MKKRLAIAFPLVTAALSCSVAQAAESGKAALPTSGAFGAIIGLAVVVALIFALGWLMRRLNGPGGLQRGPLRVVGATSVGQRERVVLVRYQDSILVLGVAAGHISLLKETPAPVEPSPSGGTETPSFLARLRAVGGVGSHG